MGVSRRPALGDDGRQRTNRTCHIPDTSGTQNRHKTGGQTFAPGEPRPAAAGGDRCLAPSAFCSPGNHRRCRSVRQRVRASERFCGALPKVITNLPGFSERSARLMPPHASLANSDALLRTSPETVIGTELGDLFIPKRTRARVRNH